MMTLIKKFYFISLPILTFLVYFALLSANKTVNPDAQIIFEHLNNVKGAFDYLIKIAQLQTIDFQPIRDITLFLDIFFFEHFDLNTSISQNLLWWIGSCYFIWKIQKVIFSDKNKSLIFLLLLAFAVYPLFSFTISWGMARKHIVSFFFIIFATYEIVSPKCFTIRRSLKISALYLLSGFAQPIHILWPIWASIYLKFNSKMKWRELLKIVAPLFLAFTFLTIINFLYYKYSPTYNFHYASKTSEIFNLSDKVLALGHYHFQLFFPFLLSFNYELGDYHVLVGLLILVIFTLILYKRSTKLEVLFWLVPGYLSLVVILNTPHHLFDSYLLLPGFSLLMLISHLLPQKINGTSKIGFSLLILLFSLFSHFESKKWLDPVTLTQSSFENRQNCKNALNFLKMTYESHLNVSENLRNYLTKYDCLKDQNSTHYKAISNVVLISYILFHEDALPIQDRINRLKFLSQKSLIAHLSLAALYLKNSKTYEADMVIEDIVKLMKDKKISGKEFHPITAYYVHPYCKKKNWEECLTITSKLSQKPKNPYL